jgi:metal-responsive CopG/Arc/MetJ family transcriptional regulator
MRSPDIIKALKSDGGKQVRINVTMPADILDQIDRYAEREGFTRSGFLAQAAKKAMAA